MTTKQMSQAVPAYHFDNLYALEETHWWFKGRIHWASQLVADWKKKKSGKISYLDIGAGTGRFALTIGEKFGCDPILTADNNPAALHYLEKTGKFQVLAIDAEKTTDLPLKPDLITCMDVLEHLKDDEGFLKKIATWLAPGGLFVMAAPALPSLYSQWDVNLGHYRRYTAPDLEKKLVAAALQPRRINYMWSFLAPLFPIRKFSKNPQSEFSPVPGIFNETLFALSKLEFQVQRLLPIPFGSSLFAAAEKP